MGHCNIGSLFILKALQNEMRVHKFSYYVTLVKKLNSLRTKCNILELKTNFSQPRRHICYTQLSFHDKIQVDEYLEGHINGSIYPIPPKLIYSSGSPFLLDCSFHVDYVQYFITDLKYWQKDHKLYLPTVSERMDVKRNVKMPERKNKIYQNQS